jgi:hypothetical protein
MTTHTIEVSEEVYRRLHERAGRLQLTPEQMIERMLVNDVPSFIVVDDESDIPIPPANSEEALAAVRRLTTLFADLTIPNLEQVLSDPMIALANVGISDHEA